MNLIKKYFLGVFVLVVLGALTPIVFAKASSYPIQDFPCGHTLESGYTTALCDAHIVVNNDSPLSSGGAINAQFHMDLSGYNGLIGGPNIVKFDGQNGSMNTSCGNWCQRAWSTGLNAPTADGCYNVAVQYEWSDWANPAYGGGPYVYTQTIPYQVGSVNCSGGGSGGGSPNPDYLIPGISINATETSINMGQDTTIIWETVDTSSCTIRNENTEEVLSHALNGSINTGSLYEDTTFTAGCSGVLALGPTSNNLAREKSFFDIIKEKVLSLIPRVLADMWQPPDFPPSASASVTVFVTEPLPPVVSLVLKSDQEKDLVKKSNNSNLGTTYLAVFVNDLPSGSCTLKNVTNGTSIGAPFNNSPIFQYPNPNVSNLQNDSNNFQLQCTNPALNPPIVNVKAQSGTLTTVSCTIPSGSSQCSATGTWTTVNPQTNTPTILSASDGSITPVSLNGTTGTWNATIFGTGMAIGATSKTISLTTKNMVDGESSGSSVENTLDTKAITVSCAPTTAWNGTICAPIATVPTVTTVNPVTNITSTSASGSGTIVSNGASAVTVSGIVWSTANIQTNRNPASIDPLFKTTTGWTTVGGPWTPFHVMGPLQPGTTYHYRAYAINGIGYAYGSQVDFTTLPDTSNVMFGSLTASLNPCTIAANASSCNTNLSWTINNTESVLSQITANGMTPITLSTPTIGNDYGATVSNVTVPYPSRTFYLYNNAKSLVPSSPNGTGRVVNAQCASGTSWNGTICVATPSGTLTATNCSIPLGANRCNTSLNWTTTNPLTGIDSAVTSNYPINNTTVFTGDNGTNQTASVPYNSRSFFLYHNGVELDSVTPSALCVLGTIWNTTSNTCVTNISYTVTATAGANGTISPATRTVGSGETTTFTVTPNSGYTATIGGTCPRGNLVGTTYTTGAINSNCTVTATFSGSGGGTGDLTISPLTCDISQGASTCTVTGATWTTKNATQPALVDMNTGTVLSTLANNSTPLQVWVAYPQTVFNLRQNGIPGVLDTETVTAKCVTGSSWDGAKCVAGTTTTGTITASDCTIAMGQNKCSSNISWSTVNPVTGLTSAVTTPTNITVATGNNDNTTYNVNYGSRDFYLYHGIELGNDSATASCVSGTNWDGAICVAGGVKIDGVCGSPHNDCSSGNPSDLPDSVDTYMWQCLGINGGENSPICTEPRGSGGGITINFEASPKRIFKGRSSTLTWKAEGATSCTGTNFDTGNQVESNVSVKPDSTTTYTLTCTDGAGGSAIDTAEVKVSVIKFFEI